MLFQQPKNLEQLLRDKSWILADGATGKNLFNLGLSFSDAPELWNKIARNKFKALYRRSVDAGSDLFLTNSFRANRSGLNLHGAEHRAAELSCVSAEIGRDIANAYNRTLIVAECIGPTGELMDPMGNLSYAVAVGIFHEQAEGLKADGAYLAWIETISSAD